MFIGGNKLSMQSTRNKSFDGIGSMLSNLNKKIQKQESEQFSPLVNKLKAVKKGEGN